MKHKVLNSHMVLAIGEQALGIPIYTVENNWNGYLEDRRPASNADPYKIINHIVSTLK